MENQNIESLVESINYAISGINHEVKQMLSGGFFSLDYIFEKTSTIQNRAIEIKVELDRMEK